MNNLLMASLVLLCAAGLQAAPNELTASEKADGWKLLFDGKTTAGWRSFKKQTFPDKGWLIEVGVSPWMFLCLVPRARLSQHVDHIDELAFLIRSHINSLGTWQLRAEERH